MPIAICGKCEKPVKNSYHDFRNVCICRSDNEQEIMLID